MKVSKIPFSWGKLIGKIEDSVMKLRQSKFEGRFLPWATKWANAVGSDACRNGKLTVVMGRQRTPCIDMRSRRVIVGYSNEDLAEAYNVWETRCHAYLGHEMGHENFTNCDVQMRIIRTISEDFAKQFPGIPETEVSKMVCDKMAAMLHNIVEDGRIETQFARVYNEFMKMFRNNNLHIWRKEKDMPKDDFNKWFRALIFLSVLGVPPIWMRKLPKNDPLRKVFADCSSIMDKCVEESVHENAEQCFYDVYEASKEYLINALKEAMENSPKKQQLINQMREFMEDAAGTAGSGPSSSSSGGSSSGSGSSGSGKKNGSPRMGGKRKGQATDGGKDKASAAGDGKDEGADKDGDEGSTTTPPDKTNTYMGDNVHSEGHTGGAERGSEEDLAIDWDELEEAAREAEQEDECKAPMTTAQKEELSISDELSAMYEAAGDDYAVTFREVTRGEAGWQPITLPNEINTRAKVLAKTIQNIRASRCHSNPKDKGRINCRKLYKYAVKDYNIFKEKKIVKGGMAGAIAWDGSGSMSGPKQVQSGEACALVERAFQDIPLKIINFSVAYQCEHYVVKDFDEKSKNLSYSYGYAKWRGFNGGNKDGYSIRVLTRQLLARNEERKFLFILSDGLPSDYSGGFRQGRQDVHDAVKEAIDQGIEVIAIAFGTAYDRESNHSDYEFMYTKAGAQLIECDPKDIATHLTKIMTKFALSK